MKKTQVDCPLCHSSEHVYKVSEIYLSGVESLQSRHPLKDNLFDHIFRHISQKAGRRFVEYATKRTLVSKFAPPSSGKASLTRHLTPDFIVGITLAVSVFFLSRIYTEQNRAFLPALIFVLVMAGAYLLGRKKIITRADNKHKAAQLASRQVEQAIGRWMDLYYCAADYIVFDQRKRMAVPLQDMPHYLIAPDSYIPPALPPA